MEQLLSHNMVLTAAVIFGLRVVDVTLGTIRTISMVNGRVLASVILGFFEVLIWITVISGVMLAVKESPILLIAYALGFAAGNGVGILVERRIAIGTQLLQLFSRDHGHAVAEMIRDEGQPVTVFTGEGREGPVLMLTITCARKKITSLIKTAQEIDPDVFYVVESVAGLRRHHALATHPTGWRAVTKKK